MKLWISVVNPENEWLNYFVVTNVIISLKYWIKKKITIIKITNIYLAERFIVTVALFKSFWYLLFLFQLRWWLKIYFFHCTFFYKNYIIIKILNSFLPHWMILDTEWKIYLVFFKVFTLMFFSLSQMYNRIMEWNGKSVQKLCCVTFFLL